MTYKAWLQRHILQLPDLPLFGQAGHADPLLLTKAGDVETNPVPTTLNKRVDL